MAQAFVTMKLNPRDFDLIRSAVEVAISAEEQIQENIKDECTDEKGVARVAGNKDYQASMGRSGELAILLGQLNQ